MSYQDSIKQEVSLFSCCCCHLPHDCLRGMPPVGRGSGDGGRRGGWSIVAGGTDGWLYGWQHDIQTLGWWWSTDARLIEHQWRAVTRAELRKGAALQSDRRLLRGWDFRRWPLKYPVWCSPGNCLLDCSCVKLCKCPESEFWMICNFCIEELEAFRNKDGSEYENH